MADEDISLHNLEQPHVLTFLGAMSVHALKAQGIVTFYVDEEGCVRIANPLHVFLDVTNTTAPAGKKMQFLRPIITDGRPQYVAYRDDGSLWEVAYVDEETPEEVSR